MKTFFPAQTVVFSHVQKCNALEITFFIVKFGDSFIFIGTYFSYVRGRTRINTAKRDSITNL